LIETESVLPSESFPTNTRLANLNFDEAKIASLIRLVWQTGITVDR